MGDVAEILPCVPSPSAYNALLSSVTVHIIRSGHIYVAMHNSSLIPSCSCQSTSSYLWNDVRAANNISHSENLQHNGY